MTYCDEAIVFPCAGVALVGIVSRPETPGDAGLVVLVGGPQYRAGSHRQFVFLARRAAAAGIATMRFDYRGMGDSGGAPAGFEAADDDVRAAIDALVRRCPTVRRVFLWGLCDGASAALMYLQRSNDARVAGVCILNPWVRTAATLARTQVRHYYGQRLLRPEFWRKLLRGGVDIGASLRELAGKLHASVRRDAAVADMPFQARMAAGVKAFQGRILLVLSGRDLTAKEFVDHTAADATWADILKRPEFRRVAVPDADHTFSTAAWRIAVEDATLDWIRGSASN